MAKSVKPYPLSKCSLGTNRRVQEVGPNQTVDGEDIINTESDVQRRDAFTAFQTSAPHFLPAGQVTVMDYNYGTQTWTTWTDRGQSSLAYSSLRTSTSGRRLFIGCDSQFQGFHWSNLGVVSGTFGSVDVQYIRIRFLIDTFTDASSPSTNEPEYVTASWVLDSTTRVQDDDADKIQPLTRNGYVSWHKSQQPAAWDTKRTANSLSKYWVIVDVSSDPQNFDAALDGFDYSTAVWTSGETFKLEPPGVRCFQLQPVKGIFPLGTRGRAQFLVSSLRPERRGQETGTQIGAMFAEKDAVEPLGIEKDYGTGIIGTYTNTAWSGGSKAIAAYTLEKLAQNYEWQVKNGTTGQHLGSFAYPLLASGVTLSDAEGAEASTTSAGLSTSFLPGHFETELENCVFLCTNAGTGGPTSGRYNKVKLFERVNGSFYRITFSEAWDNAIVEDAIFSIYGIPHFLTTQELDIDSAAGNLKPWIPIANVPAGQPQRLYLKTLEPDGSSYLNEDQDITDLSIDNSVVSWSIQKEARFELPPCVPDMAFDDISRRHIFALGRYNLHYWDGVALRQLEALSDANDLVVQSWTGYISDRLAGDVEAASVFEKSTTLRGTPPQGNFVEVFASRIFVAGIHDYPTAVQYSAPANYNDVWPLYYETTARSSEGSPITGMSVLNDELVVFTRDAIFAAPPPDDLGYMSLTSRSQGIGFVNNRVVKRAVINGSSVLIGANGDGIYMYTGAEPRVVMGDWKALLEGGVNQSAMHTACAEVSYYDNRYYIAVPSRLSSVPDKIIVYDFDDGSLYVWNAPFGGVTAMALDRDDNGNEVLLFGHEDGTISRLMPNLTDDGTSINGYAKTPPFTSGGLTMAITGYMVTLENLGDTETVTIKEYPNEDASDPNVLYTGTFDAGVALDLGAIELLNEKQKTKKINAKSGTRCESVQLEISGTSQWRLRYWEILMTPTGQRSK